MKHDDDQSSSSPDFEESGDDILDHSTAAPTESRATPIQMVALFFAFIKEVMPELLERFDRESKHDGQAVATTTDQRTAVLNQEAIIESEQFVSNAIIRVLEGYHAIVVDGRRIPLDHKQGIIFRVLVERHRRGDYSYVTAAQLTTIIATDYCDKLWTNLDKDDVVQVYSRLRRDIRDRATSTIIEHNGTRGTQSGYRLSIPADNILLPEPSDIETR